MKVMVIVKANADSEAGVMPSQEILTAMGNYNEELAKAGLILAGEGLHPSSKGKRVRFSGKTRTVIDGPFAETKELIAGYWLWRVKSIEEALEWLKRAPFDEETEIEIRPVFEAEDFGEVFTPELREQEASIRAVAIKLQAPRFENAPDRVIVGHNATYTFQDMSGIPSQWERLMPHVGTIAGRQGTDTFGVSWNCTNAGFDYLVGVVVADGSPVASEFMHVRLPARRYTVFTHTDHISSIKATFDTICHQWVPDCGLNVANAPWLERYSPSFNAHTGLGGVEIWVPLG